jgi:hypothetical protein
LSVLTLAWADAKRTSSAGGADARKRGGQDEKDDRKFSELLRRSIQQGIAAIVGRDTATAVEFYLDSSLAVKDIAAYTVALHQLFGAGSKFVEERCARTLYTNLGLEFKVVEGSRLDAYVEAARTQTMMMSGRREEEKKKR